MTKKTNTKLLTNVPVSKLVLSPLNPRQNVEQADVEALAQSIKACGLIQNLVGLKEGDKIGIVAGGRRLRALQYLLENKEILASFPVSVRMAETEEQALEWANAENTARKGLNPAEEIKAYRTMQEKGFAPDKIAIAFAQTVRHVKGRLRLANLAEPILAALEAGEVTLDTASAYTITDDQEKQAELFGRMNGAWNGDNEYYIKRCLMEEVNSDEDRRVRFVGREAYEAAGGEIREDLFGGNAFYLNTDILEKQTDEKLKAEGQTLLDDGWKWVQATVEMVSWEARDKCERIWPTQPALSDEQADRLEELTEAEEQGSATPNELEELYGLQDLSKPAYLSVEKDFAGVFVSINHDGTLRLDEGYIAPEDREAAAKAGIIEGVKETASQSTGKSGQPEGFNYSRALLEDMNTIRTGALQAALLTDADLARDIAIFSMINRASDTAFPVQISTTKYKNLVEEHGQALPEELDLPASNWISNDQVLPRFLAFRALPDQEKTAILTNSVALSIAAHVTSDTQSIPFVELLADSLSLNVRDTWTPNSTFFKRLKAAQLDEIESYIHGKPVSASFAGMKKGGKVARLHALFNNETDRQGLPNEAKERIATWVPDCMINRPAREEENTGPDTNTSQDQEDEEHLAAA